MPDWTLRDARPDDLGGIVTLYETSGLDALGSSDLETLRINYPCLP